MRLVACQFALFRLICPRAFINDINEIKSKIRTLPILYIVYPNSNHRTMVQHGVDIMSVNTNIKRDALVKFVNELLLLGREKCGRGRNTWLFAQNTLLEVFHFTMISERWLACWALLRSGTV